jgi:hypothetical protein
MAAVGDGGGRLGLKDNKKKNKEENSSNQHQLNEKAHKLNKANY